MNDVKVRYEGSLALNSTMQHQLASVTSEMRQQEHKVNLLSQQLGEAARMNAELKGVVSALQEEAQRAAADRQVAAASAERMARQFQESTATILDENRRMQGEATTAAKEESRRRQQQYESELAALNREVESYRNEAQGAGAHLRTAVERLHSRLQSEEAQLDMMRNHTGAMAANEAQAIGSLRGQVAELQSVLAGMSHQLAVEQGLRRADASQLDANMRNMEAQAQAAQDAIVARTVNLIESKAQGFIKAIKELEDVTEHRDEETRVGGEQLATAVARAAARKERAALERLLILESSLRDLATTHAQTQGDLQGRIDKGVSDLAVMMETARRSTEDREASLREQINGALQKVRAYARDMEESLEQERLKLEEVVKVCV